MLTDEGIRLSKDVRKNTLCKSLSKHHDTIFTEKNGFFIEILLKNWFGSLSINYCQNKIEILSVSVFAFFFLKFKEQCEECKTLSDTSELWSGEFVEILECHISLI